MASTIVFDFDGTVAVGDGPVRAYAREMARFAGAGFAARAEAEIDAFNAGRNGGYRDGYDIVGVLAAEAGVPAAERQAAYLASRRLLGSEAAPAAPAPGLAGILERLPKTTRVVLATNAPADGIESALTAWGIRARFDELHVDTGKPAGLGPIIDEALGRGPVLAIGDIVENDLAPAAERGADTALVGATATGSAAVTMRAADLVDLADRIVAWARDAELPTSPHESSLTPSER